MWGFLGCLWAFGWLVWLVWWWWGLGLLWCFVFVVVFWGCFFLGLLCGGCCVVFGVGVGFWFFCCGWFWVCCWVCVGGWVGFLWGVVLWWVGGWCLGWCVGGCWGGGCGFFGCVWCCLVFGLFCGGGGVFWGSPPPPRPNRTAPPGPLPQKVPFFVGFRVCV
ncbi:hypothetical protein RA267_27635 [Pseudomonas syringae pv. tagetis]|uniref:hypothetical protein n=1 Tax=Pseudomonas syringae group genomosp. 7 TaxID=251699 RepID=UPI00376FCFCA